MIFNDSFVSICMIYPTVGGVPAGAGVSGMIVPFVAGTTYVNTNILEAITPLLGSLIVFADLTNFTQFRLSATMDVLGNLIGSAGHMFPRFSGTSAGTWSNNTQKGEVNISTPGGYVKDVRIGSLVTLDAGKRAPVAIQLYTSGGNGATDPSWSSILLQFIP